MAGAVKLPLVFLDRDGTIIVDKVYLNDPEGVEFIEGAIEGLKRLYEEGFKLVIVTNQSGISRGLVDVENLRLIHEKITDVLKKEGVELLGIYYCPHLPEDNCNCRKPKTGLVEHLIPYMEKERSYVIGDRLSDMEFGKNLGVKTILLKGVEPEAEQIADFVAPDFASAVEWILRQRQKDEDEVS